MSPGDRYVLESEGPARTNLGRLVSSEEPADDEEPEEEEQSMTTPIVPRPATFAPDVAGFLQRMADSKRSDRECAAVAEAHLVALENRIAQALEAVKLLHIGTAGAFLEIGQRDLNAAKAVIAKATEGGR